MTRRADVGALRALHEAATEGPWVLDMEEPVWPWVLVNGRGRIVASVGPVPIGVMWEPSFANRDLIAAMRTALPGLLDEVEALRAALPEDPYRPVNRRLWVGPGEWREVMPMCYACDHVEGHAPGCAWRRAMGGGR